MDFSNEIKRYLEEEIKLINDIDVDELNNAMNLLEETRKNNSTVYVFGNGGSASTASHMQNDFNKGISEHLKERYNFVSLCDNVATMMAIANDDCYENVFYNQLENKLKKDDVIIAISGSGNSKNIIRAVKYAKQCGNKVIGFTGYDGGELKKISDINMHVNLNNMQITEDLHIIFNHCMMYILCQYIKKGC